MATKTIDAGYSPRIVDEFQSSSFCFYMTASDGVAYSDLAHYLRADGLELRHGV